MTLSQIEAVEVLDCTAVLSKCGSWHSLTAPFSNVSFLVCYRSWTGRSTSGARRVVATQRWAAAQVLPGTRVAQHPPAAAFSEPGALSSPEPPSFTLADFSRLQYAQLQFLGNQLVSCLQQIDSLY